MKFKLWLENQEVLDYKNDPRILESMQRCMEHYKYNAEEYDNTAKFFALRYKDLPPTRENLQKYNIDPEHVIMARFTNPRDTNPNERIERYWTHNPFWTLTQMLRQERADVESELIFTTLATLMKKGQINIDPNDASDDGSAYLVSNNPKFSNQELIGTSKIFNKGGRRHTDPVFWSNKEDKEQVNMYGADHKMPPPPAEFRL